MFKQSPKQLLVEQELLGELPAGANLPEDASERLGALRQDNQEILDKYPAERVAKEIQRRLARRAPACSAFRRCQIGTGDRAASQRLRNA